MAIQGQNRLDHGHTGDGAGPLLLEGLNQILSTAFHNKFPPITNSKCLYFEFALSTDNNDSTLYNEMMVAM